MRPEVASTRASVDAIAEQAGVSKMTIYSNFGSKEGLFEAVVQDRTDRVMGGSAGVEALDPMQPHGGLRDRGLRSLPPVAPALFRSGQAEGLSKTGVDGSRGHEAAQLSQKGSLALGCSTHLPVAESGVDDGGGNGVWPRSLLDASHDGL
jgi:hypothetical protein